MVEQGDIIRLDLNPAKGHEQRGYRPVLVVSNNVYNKKTTFRVVYPISTTKREFALYIPLDGRTRTQGNILADQLRTIDINAPPFSFVEKLPDDMLGAVLEIAMATIER
jgi:mRNA interferase MazF